MLRKKRFLKPLHSFLTCVLVVLLCFISLSPLIPAGVSYAAPVASSVGKNDSHTATNLAGAQDIINKGETDHGRSLGTYTDENGTSQSGQEVKPNSGEKKEPPKPGIHIDKEDWYSNNVPFEQKLKYARNPGDWPQGQSYTFDLVELYFMDKGFAAMHYLQKAAVFLACMLMIIQVATTWTLFEGQLRFFELIREIIRFSFILFFIYNMKYLAFLFLQGFQFIGALGSGLLANAQGLTGYTPDGSMDTFSNLVWPSRLVDIGWQSISQMFSVGVDITHPFNSLVILVLCGFGFVGCFLVGLQVTLTNIEYSIVMGLGTIMLAFGACRYTKQMYDKTISAMFSFGIKMMVVYFMAGMATTLMTQISDVLSKYNDAKAKTGLLSTWANSTDNWDMIMNFLLIYFVIGWLVWKIPDLVSSISSGSSTLSAGGMALAGMGLAKGAMSKAGKGAMKLAGLGGAIGAAHAASVEAHSGGKDDGGVSDTKAGAEIKTIGGVGLSNDGMSYKDKNGVHDMSEWSPEARKAQQNEVKAQMMDNFKAMSAGKATNDSVKQIDSTLTGDNAANTAAKHTGEQNAKNAGKANTSRAAGAAEFDNLNSAISKATGGKMGAADFANAMSSGGAGGAGAEGSSEGGPEGSESPSTEAAAGGVEGPSNASMDTSSAPNSGESAPTGGSTGSAPTGTSTGKSSGGTSPASKAHSGAANSVSGALLGAVLAKSPALKAAYNFKHGVVPTAKGMVNDAKTGMSNIAKAAGSSIASSAPGQAVSKFADKQIGNVTMGEGANAKPVTYGMAAKAAAKSMGRHLSVAGGTVRNLGKMVRVGNPLTGAYNSGSLNMHQKLRMYEDMRKLGGLAKNPSRPTWTPYGHNDGTLGN